MRYFSSRELPRHILRYFTSVSFQFPSTLFFIIVSEVSMLVGSIDTAAWGAFTRPYGKKTPRYGRLLRINWINSRGQPINGGPSAWGLGEGLNASHIKNKLLTKCHERFWIWTDSKDKWPELRKIYVKIGKTIVRCLYRKVGCGGIYWIDLPQGRNYWKAYMNTVISICVP